MSVCLYPKKSKRLNRSGPNFLRDLIWPKGLTDRQAKYSFQWSKRVMSGRNKCMKDEYFRMKNLILYLNILSIVCYIRDRFRFTTLELEPWFLGSLVPSSPVHFQVHGPLAYGDYLKYSHLIHFYQKQYHPSSWVNIYFVSK